MDWQRVVPGETGWEHSGVERAREVRLRPGQGALVVRGDGLWQGSHVLSPQEVALAAQALSGYSLAARREELNRGFLPLAGGHRLGVCGVTGGQGMVEITSLCVRLAHEVKGAGEGVFPQIRGLSTLIIGAPGTGKTTLLRDLIRLYSRSGAQVGVADERGELAACRDGAPQLDVGPMTDVMTGMDKARALLTMVRSMAPQVVAADEIGGEKEAEALLEARKCGVTVLSCAHGRGVGDARRRPGLEKLMAANIFDVFIALSAPGAPPRVTFREEEKG